MMLCASASFEATGPGSAVAAEVVPKLIATTHATAGMWRILKLIAGSPSGGRNDAAPSPWERHKVRRVTAFPDDCKAELSQKVRKVSCLQASQTHRFLQPCGTVTRSCGGSPDS